MTLLWKYIIVEIYNHISITVSILYTLMLCQVLGPINTSMSHTGLVARYSQQEMRDTWTCREEEQEADEGVRISSGEHDLIGKKDSEKGEGKVEMYYRWVSGLGL